MKPHRTTWADFPNIIIHAGDVDVKRHFAYRPAKHGDSDHAEALVTDLLSPAAVSNLSSLLAGSDQVVLVSAHAYEATGVNAIPQALAEALGRALQLSVEYEVVQTNVVAQTGASGYGRLARPALFDGPILVGRSYLLVDDFVGQGGTFANLRGFIHHNGGVVIAATALTGKPYSAKLALSSQMLGDLRRKHGKDLESWWRERFGYAFDCLTESEARYLLQSPNACTIRDRLAAEEQARSG